MTPTAGLCPGPPLRQKFPSDSLCRGGTSLARTVRAELVQLLCGILIDAQLDSTF